MRWSFLRDMGGERISGSKSRRMASMRFVNSVIFQSEKLCTGEANHSAKVESIRSYECVVCCVLVGSIEEWAGQLVYMECIQPRNRPHPPRLLRSENCFSLIIRFTAPARTSRKYRGGRAQRSSGYPPLSCSEFNFWR